MEKLGEIIGSINGLLYDPILIIILIAVGLYFTFRLGFIQISQLGETLRVVRERSDKGRTSSFQALMVSTASRVGTGNIIGVSQAICLGGYGAIFWMWMIAIVGGASAFVESTLAQIYKKRDSDGNSYGGPSYYIETALKSRFFGIVFAVALILTYAIGFNMLAAYNLQTSFQAYNFYNPSTTPMVIGGVLAIITAICVLGGGRRIIQVTSFLVPIMGVIYVIVALYMIITNLGYMPTVIGKIFSDAFNFRAIFGGLSGSALMYGIKRGLYSNEAGIGSAPNAAAAADVSHPAKQGLVQMLSVFLDTLVICSATAFMAISSGIEPTAELAGAPFVQQALSTKFGTFGPAFVTLALVLFAFTTLIGNLFYVDNNLAYINGKMPSKGFMTGFRILAVVVIFFGALSSHALAWDVADLLMGIMALINLPVILILGKQAKATLDNYKAQKAQGVDPVFKAADIGIDDSQLDYWK